MAKMRFRTRSASALALALIAALPVHGQTLPYSYLNEDNDPSPTQTGTLPGGQGPGGVEREEGSVDPAIDESPYHDFTRATASGTASLTVGAAAAQSESMSATSSVGRSSTGGNGKNQGNINDTVRGGDGASTSAIAIEGSLSGTFTHSQQTPLGAAAIFAVSSAGNGGTGSNVGMDDAGAEQRLVGGDGGTGGQSGQIHIANSGELVVRGHSAIVAFSRGGDGGKGGAEDNYNRSAGNGGNGGMAGAVDVANIGAITILGDGRSGLAGIAALSISGSGANGGDAPTQRGHASGGRGADGQAVTVDAGRSPIWMQADSSVGLLATSSGGARGKKGT